MQNKIIRGLGGCVTLGMMAYASTATAISFDWNDFAIEINTRFTVGAGWRVEERDESLLGKQNVPGQQGLCSADDCLDFSGNTAPIDRLVNAKGGFFLHNTDNGNMNYDKGDMYSGLARLDSTLTIGWEDWTFKISGLSYYDRLNAKLEETHFDTTYQSRHTQRRNRVQNRLSKHAEIREAFISGIVPIFGDNEIGVTVGNQRLRWGEANLHLFNTLDFINPLDATIARQPGLDLASLQIPTGMVLVTADISDTIALEAFYQYDWEPTRPDPSGSFFSTFDAAGGGDYAGIHLGQFPEDPNKLYQSEGLIGLVSSTTTTLRLDDEHIGDAKNGGQYGIKFSWYAEDFNGGTEFGFYFANYHSRLPLASGTASEYSCTRDALVPGNIAAALVACNGFNGSINATGLGREPFPVDTASVFLDYPEDIRMYGVSFNTNVGNWSLAGEYSFQENLPVQVLLSDLFYALEQNAAPAEDLPIGPGALIGGVLPAPLDDVVSGLAGAIPLGGLTFPGARSIFPDFLTRYRDREYAPGEYVPGYERLKVGQLALTGIRIFPAGNIFKAEQVLFLVEAGMTHIVDMPEEGELYFQGAGDITHPTPGSDGTGQPDGQPVNTLNFNPTQQTDGFAEDFAWGMRTLIRATYNDVFGWGINLEPTVIGFYDVKGIAPFPSQNYVEDNALVVPGLFFEIGQAWNGTLLYQYHSGDRNLLRDRDNVSFSLSYSF